MKVAPDPPAGIALFDAGQPMSLQPPPPPPGWPAPPPPVPEAMARKTLVGGLPWNPDAAPVAGPGAVFIDQRPVEKIDSVHDADPLSARSLRARFDEFVRRSPPLTVSLSLHAIVLISLALVFVRHQRQQRPVLDLSFASTTIHETKGVEIPPAPEPVEEPEVEEAVTKEPPVEDPVAAPPQMVETEDAPGAVAAESRSPVIGSLLAGREEGQREALVERFGGSDATEAAVARALAWIVKQQQRDGLWSLQGPYANGGNQENRLAASAMALLALQGAGNTPKHGRHRNAVGRGVKALVKGQLPSGDFDLGLMPEHHSLYAHAQATIVLCELYGMTKDEAFAIPARRAVDYAIAAQGPNGGWRYGPGDPGDMSVTGWFMMALKSAEMAGIEVPAKTLAALEAFVDDVAKDGGTRYGYRRELSGFAVGHATAALSAEGLLCRQYLGWRHDDPRLVRGLELLVEENPIDFDTVEQLAIRLDAPGRTADRRDKNAYAWYYITQVAHHQGGDAWNRWNARLTAALPEAQCGEGREFGSWDPAHDLWGSIGGRMYMTCFCTLMLEVYYRHLPLHGGGVAEMGAGSRAPLPQRLVGDDGGAVGQVEAPNLGP